MDPVGGRTALGRALARLWRVPPSVSGAAAQRRSRVATGVLLCLMVVGLTTLALAPLLDSDPRGTLLLAGTLAALAASYALVRRGHVTTGSFLAIAAVEAVIWLSRVDAPHDEGQATLYFLGIALLIAGLLLPARGATGVALATLASAWLLEALIDGRLGAGLEEEDARLLVFLAAVAALAVASSLIAQRDARRLDESSEQLRQLAENIPEVFFIISSDFSRTFYVSPAYATVWGRTVEQAMADPVDWMKGVHPEDLPAVQAAMRVNPLEPLEFRVVQPGGAVRHMRSRTFPVRDVAGEVTRFVGIAEDVTDIRVAAERLREANEKLRAAAAERQRMFRQVSHDLANPLSPITLNLALLGRAELPEKPRHAVQVIQRNVEQIKRHVEDLRDLARIEGSSLRLEPASVDLAALAREAAESFQESAAERGLRLHVQASGPLVANADRGRVAQVLYNLLTNALKFTPAGGTVTLRAAAKDGAAELSVQDSGRGLAPDEAARLFQPFSQVHDPGETKERGTGLGLYICKGIVEAHGGRIRLESAGRGKGTTFIFTLPLPGTT